MLELFLGGARSGKSRLAEQRANDLADMHDLQLIYIATAEAGDGEMHERIQQHQQRRGAHWRTVEEPIQLADTLAQVSTKDTCVLVDCLTLWGTNLLLHSNPACFQTQTQLLLQTLPKLPGHVLLVSNEVGQGVVPADALSRRFVDEMGSLHQAIAKRCDKVEFVVAGLAMPLKM